MGDGECGDLDGGAFGGQSAGEKGADGKVGGKEEEWIDGAVCGYS